MLSGRAGGGRRELLRPSSKYNHIRAGSLTAWQDGDWLLDKSRDGATVRKRYEKPATPCDRLLSRDNVDEETK